MAGTEHGGCRAKKEKTKQVCSSNDVHSFTDMLSQGSMPVYVMPDFVMEYVHVLPELSTVRVIGMVPVMGKKLTHWFP